MSNIDTIKHLIKLFEAMKVDEFLSLLTEDAEYRFGNYPAVTGPEGIREFAKPVMQMFKTVTHDIKDMWEFGDKVICEMDVTYTRQDGKVSTVPCLDIIQLENGKVKQLQAFIDASPAIM